eukprot:447041-Pelagomonas_calceolata.AAC.1
MEVCCYPGYRDKQSSGNETAVPWHTPIDMQAGKKWHTFNSEPAIQRHGRCSRSLNEPGRQLIGKKGMQTRTWLILGSLDISLVYEVSKA